MSIQLLSISKISLNPEQQLGLELLKQKLMKLQGAQTEEEEGEDALLVDTVQTKYKRQIRFLEELKKNLIDPEEVLEKSRPQEEEKASLP